MISLAPRTVQNIPDRLRREAITVLHPASPPGAHKEPLSREHWVAHTFGVSLEIVGFIDYGLEEFSAGRLIHSPFAVLAIPAIWTFAVQSSMQNRTMNRCSPRLVHTSTLKKSVATTTPNAGSETPSTSYFGSAPVLGSMPCRSRICAIVLRASSCTTLDSAPWIRRYPNPVSLPLCAPLKPRSPLRYAVAPVSDGPFHCTSAQSVPDAMPTKSPA